jgi:hypothetical protein
MNRVGIAGANIFFGIFKATEDTGSGSVIIHWYGSADPDPFQNVTGPEHCLKQFRMWGGTYNTVQRVGSGSVVHWYGSANPDPDQNVTDPEHCPKTIQKGVLYNTGTVQVSTNSHEKLYATVLKLFRTAGFEMILKTLQNFFFFYLTILQPDITGYRGRKKSKLTEERYYTVYMYCTVHVFSALRCLRKKKSRFHRSFSL